MIAIPNSVLLEILGELIDTGGILETVALRLFSSDSTPGPLTTWADLVEATFSGYAAAAAIPWNLAYIDVAGNVVVQTECHQFVQTATTVSETVYGWAITTGAGPVVLRAAERFAVPVPFTVVGRAIQISGRFSLATGAG